MPDLTFAICLAPNHLSTDLSTDLSTVCQLFVNWPATGRLHGTFPELSHLCMSSSRPTLWDPRPCLCRSGLAALFWVCSKPCVSTESQLWKLPEVSKTSVSSKACCNRLFEWLESISFSRVVQIAQRCQWQCFVQFGNTILAFQWIMYRSRLEN